MLIGKIPCSSSHLCSLPKIVNMYRNITIVCMNYSLCKYVIYYVTLSLRKIYLKSESESERIGMFCIICHSSFNPIFPNFFPEKLSIMFSYILLKFFSRFQNSTENFRKIHQQFSETLSNVIFIPSVEKFPLSFMDSCFQIF